MFVRSNEDVKSIVEDIISDRRKVLIRCQNISQLDRKGLGPIRAIEFLSFYKTSEREISGGELFKAAAEMGVVAKLDLKALDGVIECLKKGEDNAGNQIPSGINYHVNLSQELLDMTSNNLGDLTLKIQQIKDECEEKGGEAVFELSEKLNHERNYDHICNLLRTTPLTLALDDSYFKEGSYFRTPAIFEFEFQRNIKYMKLDCHFLWEVVDRARFPATLKGLIERHNCKERLTCPYGTTLIVEGCKNKATVNQLLTIIENISRRDTPKILIQGEMAPHGRVSKTKFIEKIFFEGG